MSNASLPLEYRGTGCLPAILTGLFAIGCFLLGWMITFGPKELYLIIGLILCVIGLLVSIYFLIFPPVALRFSQDGFTAGKQEVIRWDDIAKYEIFSVADESEFLGIKFKDAAKTNYSNRPSEAPDVVKRKFDYTLNLMNYRCPNENWAELLTQHVQGTSSTVMSVEAAAQAKAPISVDQLGKKLTRLGPKRKRYLLEYPGLAITPLALIAIICVFSFLKKGDIRQMPALPYVLIGLAVFGLLFWWHNWFTLPKRSVLVFRNGIQGESKGRSFMSSWNQISSLTICKQKLDQFGILPSFTKYEITLFDGTRFQYSNLLDGKTDEVQKFIIKQAKLELVPSALTNGKVYQKIPS